MQSSLSAVLAEFTEPHSVEQLRSVEEAIASIDRSRLSKDDIHAIFDLYERFPDDDGYGMFSWLMHALESTGGYESSLLQSVARKPGGFNVTMICRFVNGGIAQLEGTNLLALLKSLAGRADISPRARDSAESCLANPRAL